MDGDPSADRADWQTTRARQADASGYVERDGVRIFWETFGSGEPAILILPTWSVLHAAHGRFQIADLARDHRVITFDGRGNGRSDRPPGAEAYSDAEFVADAVAVLDATGTDGAVVVACSQATHWLLRLAAEHPTRVQGAVFSGTNVPLTPEDPDDSDSVPFDEPYRSTDGWAKWNAAYWRDHYEEFLRFFFSKVWTEPHSLSVIEDCVAWGLDTTPDTLIATVTGPGMDGAAEALELAARVTCPVLVIHGQDDALTPVERSVRLAESTGGQLVVLEGAGHCSGNRDPVAFDLLVREFLESMAGSAPTTVRWRRAIDRPRRVLDVPRAGEPDGLRRDLAITRALRVRMPDLVIEWLVEERLGTWLTAHDEIVHPSSRSLLSELRPTLLAGGEGRSYAAHRRHDEVRFANFMVFADVVAREPFDLVIADSAWHVDHYLHQNPELKRFAFAWLSDEVGFAPTVDESERDAVHRADANAEMIELVERYPRIRDLALFLGGSRALPEESFGPGLPSIREWTSRHFELAADDPAAPAEATRIAELISRLI